MSRQTNLSLEYRNRGFIKNYEVEGNVFQNAIVEGATKKLFNKKQDYNKIFLIVNESWGVPLQESVQTEVMKSIHKSNKVESFKLSKFDFEGFTIGGELRELCQVAPAHFNLKNQKTGFENEPKAELLTQQEILWNIPHEDISSKQKSKIKIIKRLLLASKTKKRVSVMQVSN